MDSTRSSVRLAAALALAVTACHVKLPSILSGSSTPSSSSGEQPGAAPSSGARAPGGGEAGATTGAGPAAPTATRNTRVPATLRPNPIVLDGLVSQVTESTHSLGIKQGCEGYVPGEPGAVLELEAPLADVEISAPGATVLLARFAGRYVCDSPNNVTAVPKVTLDRWPAGKVEIFAGYHNDNKQIRYAIEIENVKEKRDLGWGEVDVLALAKAPPKPVKRALAIPALPATPRGVPECRGYNFRRAPDLLVTPERPLAGLVVEARSHRPVSLLVLGPIPEDGRNVPAACYDGGATLGRLERGTYAIAVGTRGEPTPVTLLVRAPDATLDPLALAKVIPADLPVAERRLEAHFPELLAQRIWDEDALRQKLFATAPRQLFVFPSYDLDASVAQHVARVGALANNDSPPKKPVGFPAKDEPLLVVDAIHVLSADGNLFKVTPKDLVASPSGPISLPAAARNPGLKLDYSLNAAGPEDKARIAAEDAAEERYGKCAGKVWDPLNVKIQALKRTAWSEARDERIQALEIAGRQREETTCGLAKLEAHRERLNEELMASRTARRTATLKGLRKRLAGLFAR